MEGVIEHPQSMIGIRILPSSTNPSTRNQVNLAKAIRHSPISGFHRRKKLYHQLRIRRQPIQTSDQRMPQLRTFRLRWRIRGVASFLPVLRVSLARWQASLWLRRTPCWLTTTTTKSPWIEAQSKWAKCMLNEYTWQEFTVEYTEKKGDANGSLEKKS